MIDRVGWLALCMALGISGTTGAAAQASFPFDGELLLVAAPVPGSKRVPNMDVSANGAMALEMWCNRVEGQLVVAADTLTVLTGQATNRHCSPEQARRDA